MRLHELFHRHRDGVRHVVDICHPDVDLRPDLRLPEGVTYERGTPEELRRQEIAQGALVLALLGPSQPLHHDPMELVSGLRLRPGTLGLLPLAWPTSELPYHRVIAPLTRAGCQVREIASLEATSLRGVPSAIVFERVDRVAPLRGYLGGADSGSLDDPAAVLRVVNEYVLGDFVGRHLRARLLDLEHAESARAEFAHRAAEFARHGEELAQRLTECERRLRDRERRLARADARIAALEQSTSLQVGRTVVEAARHPGRGVVTVPRQMLRIWRRRRTRR